MQYVTKVFQIYKAGTAISFHKLKTIFGRWTSYTNDTLQPEWSSKFQFLFVSASVLLSVSWFPFAMNTVFSCTAGTINPNHYCRLSYHKLTPEEDLFRLKHCVSLNVASRSRTRADFDYQYVLHKLILHPSGFPSIAVCTCMSSYAGQCQWPEQKCH